MPKYRYRAIDEKGQLFKGSMTAFGTNDLEQRLASQGLTLVQERQVHRSRIPKILPERRIKPRILIEFYRRIAQTMEMGLSLIDSIGENAKMLPSRIFKNVLEEVKIGLESGKTLHESMSRFTKVFDRLDLAIVRIGEQTGTLGKCLNDLADFLEWKEDINSTIKRASIYPFFIMVVLTGVIGVWIGYVLPQMAAMMKEMGVALPGVTRDILMLSIFVQTHWKDMIAVISGLIMAFLIFKKTERGELLFHRYLLKLPVIGKIAYNIVLARLGHNFAIMFHAGMTINYIFEILSDHVLGNRYIERCIGQAFKGIQQGQSISYAFEEADVFPPLMVSGIKSGEVSGTLDDAFERLGKYYDGEAKRAVAAMINAIEPVTIIVLGGVFGVIILSILLPLYDVIGNMGNAY